MAPALERCGGNRLRCLVLERSTDGTVDVKGHGDGALAECSRVTIAVNALRDRNVAQEWRRPPSASAAETACLSGRQVLRVCAALSERHPSPCHPPEWSPFVLRCEYRLAVTGSLDGCRGYPLQSAHAAATDRSDRRTTWPDRSRASATSGRADRDASARHGCDCPRSFGGCGRTPGRRDDRRRDCPTPERDSPAGPSAEAGGCGITARRF